MQVGRVASILRLMKNRPDSGVVNGQSSVNRADLEEHESFDRLIDGISQGGGVALRDWSARDFSNIYVRFRPHLISHAGKFLRDTTQAEEVVQDSFLYLMTAMPELDSEVGILRFLKWKVRLLCLDVIRSSGRGYNETFSGDVFAGGQEEVAESIERAEDAAVVRLALAQLSPRHREVLIATVIEEKTYKQTSQQMGISENGLRQLLLRARRAFRQELVGQADAANMTVSEALRLASKRHAGKLLSTSVVGATLIVAAFIPLDFGSQQSESLFAVNDLSSELRFGSSETAADLPGSAREVAGNTEIGESVLVEEFDPLELPYEEKVETEVPAPEQEFTQAEGERTRELVTDDLKDFQTLLSQNLALSPVEIDANRVHSLAAQDISGYLRENIAAGVDLVVELGTCRESAALVPCKLFLEDSRNGWHLVWLSTNFATHESNASPGSRSIQVVATDFLVGDFGGNFGNVSVDAPVGESPEYLRLNLEITDTKARILDFEWVQPS